MTGAVDTEAPVLSRRVDGGAPSARGLLFTVLGELVHPTGGTAWTTALIDVFARLGVEEKATRQAVMRTAAAGWLDAERVGRRTRWHLTAAAGRLLAEGAERIYSFDGSRRDWDGQWLVVLARVPETDRKARHLLRSRLSWEGLGPLGPGTWIGVRTDRLREVQSVLSAAGVDDAHCFLAAHRLGDERAMVAEAWDVPAIAAAYRSFLADLADDGAAPGDAVAAQIDLVHRWRRFPLVDPGLPRALLPAAWPGDPAAVAFRRRHDQWREPSLAGWRTLNNG
ncbi:MAG: PaaX family transcriptional regulator [Geodermatophilaceae bacterium]|nr:PaaX family transcriptional regulator [Geodermatophilaceae bacterium]